MLNINSKNILNVFTGFWSSSLERHMHLSVLLKQLHPIQLISHPPPLNPRLTGTPGSLSAPSGLTMDGRENPSLCGPTISTSTSLKGLSTTTTSPLHLTNVPDESTGMTFNHRFFHHCNITITPNKCKVRHSHTWQMSPTSQQVRHSHTWEMSPTSQQVRHSITEFIVLQH